MGKMTIGFLSYPWSGVEGGRRTGPCVCSTSGNGYSEPISRDKIRVAVPSKGGILDDTKALLQEIGADVRLSNPRQYTAVLKGFSDVEVWLQRPVDIARKVSSGIVELGFTGYDLVAEYGGDQGETIPVHANLGYGECRLGVGVPISWRKISSIEELSQKVNETQSPLRVATKYSNQSKQFFKSVGIDNYELVYMDGALEASTQMGTADCIVDLISSGVTLRENLLKEVSGGTLLQSTMQLVGNRAALAAQTPQGKRLRFFARELLERIEAHLIGTKQCNLIANVEGSSPGDVARRLGAGTDLRGLDGPTISTVIPPRGSDSGMYAIGIIVPKERLYTAVEQLRRIGGSGVCVLPVSYVFEKSSRRWQTFIKDLGVEDDTEQEW